MPFIAVLVLLAISLGAVNIALLNLFRDRTTVRDALDSACTSALAGGAEVKERATYYYEALVPVKWETIIVDGRSKRVPIEWEWKPREKNYANFIALTQGEARSIADDYFKKNLELNRVNYSSYNLRVYLEFDQNRSFEVTKDRSNVDKKPPYWWTTEVIQTTKVVPDVQLPWEPNDVCSYEDREIIFPRWVKITCIATVDLNPLLIKTLGISDTVPVTIKSEAVKEMTDIVDPDD